MSPGGGHADLVERLGAADRATQHAACTEVLARVADDTALRAALLDALRADDALLRFGAAWVLFRDDGARRIRVLPALLECLDLDDGDRRWEATHMLASLGRMHGEVLPVLLHEARQGPTPRRRRMALYAVRELGPEHHETERTLLAALDDPDPDVRGAALSSVAKLPEPGEPTLDRVLDLLGPLSDLRLQRVAAVLLPDLVTAWPLRAPAVRTALERAARAPDAALSRAATLALRRLESAETAREGRSPGENRSLKNQE